MNNKIVKAIQKKEVKALAALPLSDQHVSKLMSYFADFYRAGLCDRGQISADYRTACPVHCYKKI
jgi:hypothetical protein